MRSRHSLAGIKPAVLIWRCGVQGCGRHPLRRTAGVLQRRVRRPAGGCYQPAPGGRPGPRRIAAQPAAPAVLRQRGRSLDRSSGCRLGEEIPGLVSPFPSGAPVVHRRPGPHAGVRVAGNARRAGHCAPAHRHGNDHGICPHRVRRPRPVAAPRGPAGPRRRHPRLPLIIYQDTGHLVLWEQPGRVASDLTAFVDSLRGQPA